LSTGCRYDVLLFSFRLKEHVSIIFMAAAILIAAFCIETNRSGYPVLNFLSSVACTVSCSEFSIPIESLVDEILQLVLPNTSDFENVSMKWVHQNHASE
jgi:hypothetical protein